MPKLFTYVVARDYGFAPNPFHGFCTLATCKPQIRKDASVGDWVVGTGSKSKGLEQRFVYVMLVSGTMTFDEYWRDPRFARKRPDMHSSRRRAYGDNIYHRNPSGEWQQADSHHSKEHGYPDLSNIRRDTGTNRVLVAEEFAYWGGTGPELVQFAGLDIRKSGQGHRCNFPAQVVDELVNWFRNLLEIGVLADPYAWGPL